MADTYQAIAEFRNEKKIFQELRETPDTREQTDKLYPRQLFRFNMPLPGKPPAPEMR